MTIQDLKDRAMKQGKTLTNEQAKQLKATLNLSKKSRTKLLNKKVLDNK